MAQCREGWHLDHEPDTTPDEPTEQHKNLATERADLVHIRDLTADAGAPTAAVDVDIAECDEDIHRAGVRGSLPDPAATPTTRRVRSTRRRDDAPDLPRRRVDPRTVGRTYIAPDGATYRPSMFITLTLPSYGRVRDGAPVDPDSYDYQRAARDALHFSALVDRFVQNLRRAVGWNVQYFAVVEPQRRLAPHVHLAIRGTIPRAVIRQVSAATYHQVWWPNCDIPMFSVDRPPVWDETQESYVDPRNGKSLQKWEDALDELNTQLGSTPAHVTRFGDVLNVQGILADTKNAQRCINYLCKYLTKSIHTVHPDTTDHAARLCEVMRYEPCSPRCSNWLLHGIQPKDCRPGLRPGYCRGRAHQPAHLGYPGRRVLVSRQWSGKDLADHRADRRAWALAQLEAAGRDVESSATTTRYTWAPAVAADPDVSPLAQRILRSIAHRARWRRLLSSVVGENGRAPPGCSPRDTASP